jgi:hypothetical protein
MRVDGFWKSSGPLGGQAGRSGAFGFGNNHICIPCGGYLAASEASQTLAPLIAALLSIVMTRPFTTKSFNLVILI